jgi:hypothetical protein
MLWLSRVVNPRADDFDLDQPVALQGLGDDRGRRDDAPGQPCDTWSRVVSG